MSSKRTEIWFYGTYCKGIQKAQSLPSIWIHLVRKVVLLQEKQEMFIIWWNYYKTKSFCWCSLLKSAASFKLDWRFFCCSGKMSPLNFGKERKKFLSQSRSSLVGVHCTTYPRHSDHYMPYRPGNVPLVLGCWDLLSVALTLLTTI